MPYDGAQLVRDLLLVVAAAGGVIKVAEFAVSRRHLAIRAVAGYWDNPDGTSGTLLQIEVHNEGRKTSLDYLAFTLGSPPPNWWRRRTVRFDARDARGFGLTVTRFPTPRWLEPGEFFRHEDRLETIAARAVEPRQQMGETRTIGELMRTMYAQVKCGE